MTVCIDDYMDRMSGLLRREFGARLLYIGLQGSYQRGEAHAGSDIDVMVVLDRLSVADMQAYRALLEEAGETARACGFICGREELAHWNPCEICHLLHTTRDCYGKLDGLVPPYTEDDVRTFVKLSLGNLYHEICHSYIHAQRGDAARMLPYAYKQVFFILQNLHYLRTGIFVQRKEALLAALDGADRLVLQTSLEMDGCAHCFDEAFQLLFTWCGDTLRAV